MFPSAPSVIVITPVVEFPVLRVTSLSPPDLNTPAADPVPAETSPLIATVPSVELVMVSSFSSMSPADPVISTLVLAVTVVNAPVDAEFAPIAVPSTAPPSISTASRFAVPSM